jgi:hypothetical protein
MRARAITLLILLSLCIVAPAYAANEDRYSYIQVSDIAVRLDNGTALIHVNYTVDEGTRFIFFVFGKQDLKTKLLKILNYDEAHMSHIDLSSADFTVDNASYSYGEGIYWYPSHDFNVVIPNLSVRSPQTVKNFSMVNEFPGGIGYFGPDNLSSPAENTLTT